MVRYVGGKEGSIGHLNNTDLRATVCPYCGLGCGIGVWDGSAFPLEHHPVSQGGLFLRGWASAELLKSPLRLVRGQIRDPSGRKQSVSIEDGLRLAVEKIREIKQRYGPESLAVLASARLTTEEIALIKKLADSLGTPHRDSFQRLGFLPFSYHYLDDVEAAQEITVIATDPAPRHPQVHRRLVRAYYHGCRIRFVGCRQAALSPLTTFVGTPPGWELDRVNGKGSGLTLLSSEVGLQGQGARAWNVLNRERTLFLTDYVNQRGLMEARCYPTRDGMGAFEILRAARDGRIKALLIFGDDPSEFFPSLTEEAFARLEWSVVVDHVQTKTSDRAHLTLPGSFLWEKEGTVCNTEGRVQQVGPIEKSPTGWTEGQIALFLTDQLGNGGNEVTPPPLPYSSSSVIPDTPDQDFPFLISLDFSTFWNNHIYCHAAVSVWREVRSEKADFPDGYLAINAEDAQAAGLRPFTLAIVESREGKITLRVRLDGRLGKGSVLIPVSLWEKVGAALGALSVDPSLKIPIFRPTAVRLQQARQ